MAETIDVNKTKQNILLNNTTKKIDIKINEITLLKTDKSEKTLSLGQRVRIIDKEYEGNIVQIINTKSFLIQGPTDIVQINISDDRSIDNIQILSEASAKSKYLKYKQKYLELKELINNRNNL